MIGKIDEQWGFGTKLLNEGAYFDRETTNPEALPIHMSTAHNVNDLEDLERRYEVGGYCYNRNRNPNRTALNELMNCSNELVKRDTKEIQYNVPELFI